MDEITSGNQDAPLLENILDPVTPAEDPGVVLDSVVPNNTAIEPEIITSPESVVEEVPLPAVPEPETSPENIIFTPEDYQKMTGETTEDNFSIESNQAAFPASPMPEENFASPLPIVEPSSVPVPLEREPETVYAPVPMTPEIPPQEEPVSNIPNPDSFYVGYKPEAPAPVVPAGLSARMNAVSAEQKSKNNKIFLIFGLSALGVLLLLAGGIFGYKWYQTDKTKKILTKAGENLVSAKEVSTEFTVGTEGFSLKAKLDVDKDQDIRFKMTNDLFPIEALYLKASDKLYFVDLAQAATTTTSSSAAPTKSWVEVSNVKKAIEAYGKSDLNLSSLDIQKSFFTPENQKYFSKNPDESIDGVNLYKFTFVVPQTLVDTAFESLKKQLGDAAGEVGITTNDTKVEFWISKADNKVYKINGNLDISLTGSGETQPLMGTWAQAMKYNFKEDIKLPSKPKISNKIDLSKQLKTLLSNGVSSGSTSTTDSKNKAYAKGLQTSIEVYMANNGEYPVAEDFASLIKALEDANSDPPSGSVPIGILASSTKTTYYVRVPVSNTDSDTNNVTVEGKKYYQVAVTGIEPELPTE